MSALLQLVGVVFAVVGGFTLFRALFTPKRFTSRRPWLFAAGWGSMLLAALFFSLAGGWVPDLFVPAETPAP